MSLERNENKDHQLEEQEQSLRDEVADMLGEKPNLRGLNNIRVAVAWKLAVQAEEPGFHTRRVRNVLKEAIFGLTEGRREGMPEEVEPEYAQLLDFYTQQLILSLIQE